MKPPEPLRGLITDLDNTLWKGLVGEDGVDGICWDLDGKAQHHALYQRLLAALAESGVLLAVASRNDPDVVEKALNRNDLLIKPSSLFPVETCWDSKVESIKRILSTWNIGAEHVLYVDDDPREIDRIHKAFPAINCRVFSFKNDASFSDFIFYIRELFAKSCIMNEDTIRASSIRSQVVRNNVAEDFNEDKFHQTIDARLIITDTRSEKDSRSLDLISKTNQFNMNGARPSKADWSATLKERNMIVFTFGYEDRYGPLGRIAVMAGVQHERVLTLKNWVMSCRAFNRRIEYACLAWLFKTTGVYEVHTTTVHTKRNAVFFNMLDAFGVTDSGIIQQEAFMAACPKLSFSYQLT
jgi:FkbH-like protein